ENTKIAIIFLGLLLVVTTTSCNRSEAETIPKSPEDHLYIQRVYPHSDINQEAIREVRKEVQSLINTNQSNTKNDNTWESEGPTNIGGRVTDIARHPVQANVFYIGCSFGGVFKTTNGGDDWMPIFEDVPSQSIGNIAISKSNPEILYAGTGEANASATSGAFFGSGVYKTENGGESWNIAGLELSNHIGRLVVNDQDPNTVVAAATGKLYGKCTNRGVYKTTDGGENWEQLFIVSDSTACIDVAVHPEDDNIIYAAMWERTRQPFQRDYGGATSGIYRTLDGGNSWIRLENGLPDNFNSRGRIGLSLCKSDPNVVYATITDNEISNTFLGVYKTDNRGDSWEEVSFDLPTTTFSSFGWFFGNIRCNPTDSDEAYVLGLNAFKKQSGEENWNQLQGMHVDMHALEFFEGNTNDILVGNDGGLYRSFDGGENFFFFDNLPITQFYNIEIDFQLPERIFGGTQDNNTIGTFTGNTDDYERLLGGDGFHVNVDPRNSDVIYAEFQFGGLRKSTDRGENFFSALNGIDGADRNNWNTPVILSPQNPDVLYYGTQRLYRTIDNADNWTAISDDLTKGQHPSGSTTFGTLTTIAPSHTDPNVIYTGSDDGTLYVTRDGGIQWTNINTDLPERYVTKISVNPVADNEAIVTYSGYRYLDYQPHIMITTDYGNTWTDISNNLPEFPINDIEYDPFDQDILYIATDMGVWTSTNKGIEWTPLGVDLATTIVNDIKIHAPTNRMVAGTFGRSIFSLDLNVLSSTEESDNIDFVMYPNPVSKNTRVTINTEFEKFNVNVFDVNGRSVLSIENQKTINAAFEPGIYTVVITSDNESSSQKLIVQ
ncbi:T9SS type A sorting domain-containing protein, partial [Saprospiraceae bacterium]|nr:T9SS type A sorting domain-containing protein [Saprospiraceae bacterium]